MIETKDMITIAFVSLLFLYEIALFIRVIKIHKKNSHKPKRIAKKARSLFSLNFPENSYLIRSCSFLFMFSLDLCLSFVSIHTKSLENYFLDFPPEIMMSLPISVEMLFAVIAILGTGAWMDKKGWHYPFFVGLFLCCIGNIFSTLATDTLSFMISRGIVGCGYGLALIAQQGFIFFNTTLRTRAQSIANVVAGFYAGSICGGVVGAMLADRIGDSIVFFLSAIFMLCTVLFTFVFMKKFFKKPRVTRVKNKTTAKKIGFKAIAKYIFSRRIFSLLFFSSVPSAICLFGFMYYAVPVYLNQQGETQSDIGRVLMIYGIFMIYLAPYINKFVDKYKNKINFILFGGIIFSIALIAAAEIDGILGPCIGMMLLGLASSFAFSAQTVHATNAQNTQKLGTGNALSIYRGIERIGQALGPLCIGAIIATLQFKQGMLFIGAVYCFLTLLFSLTNLKEEKKLRS